MILLISPDIAAQATGDEPLINWTGPTRADLENVQPVRTAEPDFSVLGFYTRVAPYDFGEDGQGNLTQSIRPVSLDIQAAQGWPGRALDPVLYMGDLRFYHYEYIGIDTLRFIAADLEQLPIGEEVLLQYGDDRSSLLVISPAFEISTE
jgi:hypothetical protein